MIANNWTLAIIAIFYLCWCDVRADQRSNKVNQLEFWKREPIIDTRRLQKKQTRTEKYPRTFQAVEDANEPNEVLSYDEAHTDEDNKYKDENSYNVKSLLNGSDKDNPSSLVVWQNYVKEDKFNDMEDTYLKSSTKVISKKTSKHPVTYTKRQGEVNAGVNTEPSTVRPEITTNANDSYEEDLSPYAVSQQMTRILSEFKNTNVSTESLGRTVEFNEIVLFKISANKNETSTRFRAYDGHKYDDENMDKKIIFIVHGLSVMGLKPLRCLTEVQMLKILLGYYLNHLDKFDIFLIPIANPDGYAASKSESRAYWNKNMSPQADCRGVALDRNFDVAWNNSHDQSSCSQTYPGPNPFSEIETKAISNVLHYYGHRILAYIHVHAGTYDANTFKGDAVLFPRGYTDLPGDDDKYLDIKGEIDEAMRNASFRVLSVTVDNLYHWYGKVSGSSVDYAAHVFGIPFAMEFVMQLYDSAPYAYETHEFVDYIALTEIWERIINAVFRYFAKSAGIVEENPEE